MDTHSPFAALLVGQPTLRRRIKLGTFAALDQRVALRHAMTGMDLAESYLAHHLKIAGRSDTLFSDDAIALIHQVSRGLPRAVNNLGVQSTNPAPEQPHRSRLDHEAPPDQPGRASSCPNHIVTINDALVVVPSVAQPESRKRRRAHISTPQPTCRGLLMRCRIRR